MARQQIARLASQREKEKHRYGQVEGLRYRQVDGWKLIGRWMDEQMGNRQIHCGGLQVARYIENRYRDGLNFRQGERERGVKPG